MLTTLNNHWAAKHILCMKLAKFLPALLISEQDIAIMQGRISPGNFVTGHFSQSQFCHFISMYLNVSMMTRLIYIATV